MIAAGGLTLLTDPNFLHRGQHAYLGYGLVSKRLKQPALTIDELPPIDAVVLSHMHGDHWDRVSQKGLDHGLSIVTTPHAAKRLQHRGFANALGLSTWQHHTITKGGTTLTITSLPGRHAPVWTRRLLPPVMGTMLKEIPARFDSIDAGLLHLGGTRLPAGRRLPFGLTVTMDGRQGAELVAMLALPKSIPVHFDDYGVFASPLADFIGEMQRRGMSDRILELRRGASVTV